MKFTIDLAEKHEFDGRMFVRLIEVEQNGVVVYSKEDHQAVTPPHVRAALKAPKMKKHDDDNSKVFRWTTEREAQCAELVKKGYAYAHIAKELGTTEGSIGAEVAALKKRGVLEDRRYGGGKGS